MLSDEKAVIGLPIYLLVAIIIATMITGIFAVSIYHSWLDSQIHKVEYNEYSIISRTYY